MKDGVKGSSGDKIQVTVLTPQRLLYKGPAVAITSVNDQGEFDVLPQHSNFITLIKDRLVIHFDEKKSQSFVMDKGVVRCRENEVKVFLGL